MMWWDGGWSWWGWLVMTAVMIGFWAVVAWVVVTVVRGGQDEPGERREASTATAEAILAERYARGEIDAAEYHHRLDDINTHHHADTRT